MERVAIHHELAEALKEELVQIVLVIGLTFMGTCLCTGQI